MPRPTTFVFPNDPPVLGDPDFAADAQGYLGAFPDLLTYVEEMADFLQTDFATELANGSAALPSMAFASDLNTGFYRVAADQIGASTGGVRRWLLSNTAFQVDVPITGTAVVSSDTDVTAERLLKTVAGPAQAYRRGNILGTVSQSAGVPTGAIIQRGSNGNGEYVRFADGTQICSHQLNASATTDVTWTFPAVFATSPKTSTSPKSGGFRIGVVGTGAQLTNITFGVYDVAGDRQANNSDLFAIGRWF